MEEIKIYGPFIYKSRVGQKYKVADLSMNGIVRTKIIREEEKCYKTGTYLAEGDVYYLDLVDWYGIKKFEVRKGE